MRMPCDFIWGVGGNTKESERRIWSALAFSFGSTPLVLLMDGPNRTTASKFRYTWPRWLKASFRFTWEGRCIHVDYAHLLAVTTFNHWRPTLSGYQLRGGQLDRWWRSGEYTNSRFQLIRKSSEGDLANKTGDMIRLINPHWTADKRQGV